MEIMRTANAGVLLRLDNASILLDGVCREVDPYLATPLWVKEQLLAQLPDAICFTHCHKDHFDRDFVRQAACRVIGPEGVGSCNSAQVGSVHIQGIATRHIGAAGADTRHMSFVIQGTQCVWFLGDASPLQWKGIGDLPKPDVALAPYAYFATAKGWECLRSLGATTNLLLHMPLREHDPAGLWPAVEVTTQNLFTHLKLGQKITI